MFVWRILWVTGIVLFILGAYAYAEQGVARTIDTLRTKRHLSEGKQTPDTWTFTVSDTGTIMQDSKGGGKRNVSSIPELQHILNDAMLGPTTGDVVLAGTTYVYAAQRMSGATRILMEPYKSGPWT